MDAQPGALCPRTGGDARVILGQVWHPPASALAALTDLPQRTAQPSTGSRPRSPTGSRGTSHDRLTPQRREGRRSQVVSLPGRLQRSHGVGAWRTARAFAGKVRRPLRIPQSLWTTNPPAELVTWAGNAEAPPGARCMVDCPTERRVDPQGVTRVRPLTVRVVAAGGVRCIHHRRRVRRGRRGDFCESFTYGGYRSRSRPRAD